MNTVLIAGRPIRSICFPSRTVRAQFEARGILYARDREPHPRLPPDRPAGLERGHKLQGMAGAGLDPCTALQTSFELASGARATIFSAVSSRLS